MWCFCFFLISLFGVVAVQFLCKAESKVHCMGLFRLSIINAVTPVIMLSLKTMESF